MNKWKFMLNAELSLKKITTTWPAEITGTNKYVAKLGPLENKVFSFLLFIISTIRVLSK